MTDVTPADHIDAGTPGSQHADVHAAILGVMQAIGYVQKSGRVNSGRFSYNFAGEADLIHALRPVMIDNGLTFAVVAVDSIEHSTYQTNSGSTQRVTTARYTGRLTHAVSGTSIDVVALGEGADSGDKSTPKAATIALKYLLRQTFVIETGDDPDVHASVPAAPPQAVPMSKRDKLTARIWELSNAFFDREGRPHPVLAPLAPTADGVEKVLAGLSDQALTDLGIQVAARMSAP